MNSNNTDSPLNPVSDSAEDDGNIEACIESMADSLEILAAVARCFAEAAKLDVKAYIENQRLLNGV